MKGTENTTSNFGTAEDSEEDIETFYNRIVGSQAASSADQVDMEHPHRPGTQTLLTSDSELSIPNPRTQDMFSIATSETIPATSAERWLGTSEMGPHSMESAVTKLNETEYRWKHTRETASTQVQMMLRHVPDPKDNQQADEFMTLRLELENRIRVK